MEIDLEGKDPQPEIRKASSITINSNPFDPHNTLLAHLASMSTERKLAVAADILCFRIRRLEYASSATSIAPFIGPTEAPSTSNERTGKEQYPLVFPATLFADPFLLANAEVASIQRNTKGELDADIEELERKHSILTKFKVQSA